MSKRRHSSTIIEESDAQACRSRTRLSVSIVGRLIAAVFEFMRGTEARPDARQNSKGLDLTADTASVTTDRADTKPPSAQPGYNRDEYMEFFVDWLVGQGLAGDHDGETIENFAQQFDRYARTSPLHPDSLFKGLKAIGIAGRLTDLSREDPRYLAAKRRGVVRPRVRIYCLPDEVPELKASPSSRDRSMAA